MQQNKNTIPYGHLVLMLLGIISVIMLGVLVHDTRYIIHEDEQLLEMGEDMQQLQKEFSRCEKDTKTYGGFCSVEGKEDGSFEVIWSQE